MSRHCCYPRFSFFSPPKQSVFIRSSDEWSFLHVDTPFKISLIFKTEKASGIMPKPENRRIPWHQQSVLCAWRAARFANSRAFLRDNAYALQYTCYIIIFCFPSLEPLKGYQGEDIEIQLPRSLTMHSIDWLAVWCVQYTHNFGHVNIPDDLDVPPALGQTKLTVSSGRHPFRHHSDPYAGGAPWFFDFHYYHHPSIGHGVRAIDV